jgi:hypothetical protein
MDIRELGKSKEESRPATNREEKRRKKERKKQQGGKKTLLDEEEKEKKRKRNEKRGVLSVRYEDALHAASPCHSADHPGITDRTASNIDSYKGMKPPVWPAISVEKKKPL